MSAPATRAFLVGSAVATVCALGTLGVAWRADAEGSRERPRQCYPRGVETLLESREAHVYRLRRDFDIQTFACHFRVREPRGIDSPGIDFAYPPPAMVLAGHLLAHANDTITQERSPEGTFVTVEDLSALRRQDSFVAFSKAGFTPLSTVTIVVARRSGGTAWIGCAAEENLDERPRKNCNRRVKWVFKLDAGTRRRKLLDRGRQIDPRSLKLRHTTLSWTHDGRRRRARLR